MKKTRRFREALHDEAILQMPGVYDGFSLRLAERYGFKAAVIGGASVSESRLGWADVGLMGLEENVAVARRLASFSSIPLLADADTGYGNAVNVYFTVQAFEDAGMAGIALEDQTWPKRCGHMSGKSVISTEEMCEKIAAAREARRDPDFVIKARTDAAGVLGIDAALERLQAYERAGADHLVADAVLDAEHIERIVEATRLPVAVNMGFGIRRRSTTPLRTAKQLEQMGVAAVTYPRMLSAAAMKGMQRAFETLLETAGGVVPVDRDDLLVSFEDINDLMQLQQLNELEQRFSSPAQGERD